MTYISSANIACGYHAGNEATMQRTIEWAINHGVAIGAHPSFPDREYFGRRNQDHSPDAIFDMISRQLEILSVIAKRNAAILAHVKPHGAMYNMAASNISMAESIARAIHAFDPGLMLFGLSGSQLIMAGKKAGLKTVNEVFADRSYQADGSLTPRDQPGAMINDPEQAAKRVISMVEKREVRSQTGSTISVAVDTVCIHGDDPNAIEHAKAIRAALQKNGILIVAPANHR
jgi:UPF0271 protein